MRRLANKVYLREFVLWLRTRPREGLNKGSWMTLDLQVTSTEIHKVVTEADVKVTWQAIVASDDSVFTLSERAPPALFNF